MPAITFAIPFYRNRDFLERAIRSVFAQTIPDWSLIISDDAGPEGDLSAWIATFLHQEKIRYVRQPKNLGIAGNWNACLKLATADFVTLLHADDELEPRYAATMLDAGRRHPTASVLFCAATVIDSRGQEAFSFPDWFKSWLPPAHEFSVKDEDGLRAIYRGNFIMCPTMCYRREHLPETPFNGRWKQVLDLDFITRTIFDDRELVGLPDKCYRYRRHEMNQTQLQSDSLLRFEEELAIFRETAAAAQARGWWRASKTARRMAIIRMNLGYCVVRDLFGLRLRGAAKKTRFLIGMWIRG